MLVVKVELHPYGDPTNVQTLASFFIANDGTSGDPEYGNYVIYNLDKFGNRTVRGKVKNHRRLKESVWKLVKKAITNGRL